MSLPALRLSPRWFLHPLILVAVPLTLVAATGFLGFQYWHARQAANQSVEHSRQVIDTLDRLRENITNVAAEKRAYLLTPELARLKPYNDSDERETAAESDRGERPAPKRSRRARGEDPTPV
jgi:CHASE3 domain sensor protein